MVAHSEILLSKCALFRDQGEFIDVHLKVSEELFPAHRIVLAANSDYFHAMFAHGMKESNQEVIELKDENISAEALKIVLDSTYGGDLPVNNENVFEVLLAADHLQVTSVVQQCCDYILAEFVQLRFDVQSYCLICTIADRHGLIDLQEAAQYKMASMYKEICESDQFLSDINADQLSSLLSRDDLSAPSENFVFNSAIQWIKYKMEERMAVAAKVIGAVRLGLVDIKEVIRELNTEEMKQIPEIFMLLHESLLYSHIPSSSTFGEEKTKLRSSGPVLVAILPETEMQYFDVKDKAWKPLASLSATGGLRRCYSAETVGRKLFVIGLDTAHVECFSCYDMELKVWEKCKHPYSATKLCIVGDYMYAIGYGISQIVSSKPPQRYSFAERRWQSHAKVNISCGCKAYHYNSGVTEFHSKMYVLYGHKLKSNSSCCMHNAVLYCFDPARNVWEQKESTCQPHFGSSLFVVNSKMCVAGGNVSVDDNNKPCGSPAPVEVYDGKNNKWSIVEQNHIPANNLGAVEIEGRVYFLINKFPVDSGIRIPPGEVYPVCLDEWENLGKVAKTAVLCYVPFKVPLGRKFIGLFRPNSVTE